VTLDQQVSDVRSFNRFYTRQLGLLDEHYQGSRFTMPEGRLLYEIATRGHTTGAELARSMDVDPAYISRMLRRFLSEDLVALTPNLADRRSNSVALTGDGDTACTEIVSSSNASVARLLEALDPPRREALLGAMRTIRAILGDRAEEGGPVVLRPHRIGELGWLIHRQGLLYNQQFGWNIDFEAMIAGLYAEYEQAPGAPPKQLWIAERNGRVAGSVFCMPSEGVEGSAQLRMLYVEPDARGLGIGQTLVDQCVSFARDAGYERMRLWTHSIQQAARRCYAKAGFEIVEEWDHRSFGKNLHAEVWEQRFSLRG
jgi:DNA-binding MarR family transcriptional regulator/GNAT superfamily N-acetyltransferase